MTYIVSARRWRPQRFADLVGQQHISQTLSNAIEADRVAHAFLFTGLRGVGKTTAARILAKALNCEKGPSPEPCNQCTHCLEITEGRSVDVLEIDGASNTGVDDVREIIDNVRYQPAKSTYKIYIIDEVHMLSNNAFNALLKTLEEPPPHVKFIFATTDPQKLPATVQSRCQRYDFRRIPLALVVERLRAIAEDQDLQISDQVLFTLAREGEGSMRDAQSLLDQIAAGAAGEVTDQHALAALGLADRAVIYELGAAIIGREPATAIACLDRVDQLGCDMRRLTRDLLEHMRNLTVAHVSGGKLVPELPGEEVDELRRQAKKIQPVDADRCFRLLLQADDEVNRSPYPKLVLEMAVLRMATMDPLVPVDEILRRLEAIEGDAQRPRERGGNSGSAGDRGAGAGRRPRASAGVTRSSAAPGPGAGLAPEAAPAPVAGLAAGADWWPAFRTFVSERMRGMGSHLATCSGAEIDGNQLKMAAREGFRANYLRDPDHLGRLEELAAGFFGRRVKVVIRTEKPATAKREKVSAEPTTAERVDMVMQEPMVRAAIDILGGELAEVRQRRPRERGDGDRGDSA